jgi:hypothetical protein
VPPLRAASTRETSAFGECEIMQLKMVQNEHKVPHAEGLQWDHLIGACFCFPANLYNRASGAKKGSLTVSLLVVVGRR